MININKIVIVGGGSAGWMSAATMIRKFPNKEIVVIESPDYPTVGVGESTLGGIVPWARWIGIEDKDFMPYTEAVYKMSIKFTDFYKKDAGSFHYPFGSPYLENTANGLGDWYIKKAKYPDLDVSDYARSYFPAITLAEQNKISFNKNGKLNNFNFGHDVAYHFDATKFGQWLKNKYCIPRGVTVINSTVTEVIVNEQGVEKLIMSDTDPIYADLFIDCTGFKSMLLEGALKEPWIDFEHMLPNNRAWAARIEYTDKDKEMEPYTNCTAIGNGWVWNTPSWNRIGTGYVYSDKYVTPEEALQEFKDYLRSDKMTIHVPDRDVDSITFRDVKFRVGIHDRTFVKNVVAIGLSAGFIEPLESNGLYTVHEFLDKLIKVLDRETVTQWDRDVYNMNTKRQYLRFKEFVAQHYALSNRTDTKYWRDITEKTFQPDVPNLEPTMVGDFQELADIQINRRVHDPHSGIHCISVGMNYFPINKDIIDRWNYWDNMNYYDGMQGLFDMREMLMKNWQEEADRSPTMYQWLKENIYNDENA